MKKIIFGLFIFIASLTGIIFAILTFLKKFKTKKELVDDLILDEAKEKEKVYETEDFKNADDLKANEREIIYEDFKEQKSADY